MKYKIGDEVYWRPKGAKSPTFGRVTGITRMAAGGDIYIIQTERKGEVQVKFEHEIYGGN